MRVSGVPQINSAGPGRSQWRSIQKSQQNSYKYSVAWVKWQRQPDHRLDRSQFLRVVRAALITLVEAFSSAR
jgi:hypothetical protein